MTAALASASSAGSEPSSGSVRPIGCGHSVTCSDIRVPLDWSGHRPGTVSLQVEVSKPTGRSRGVMFLFAGGPGQASAEVFEIWPGSSWERLFPGYTLVAFDPRGTGGSGPLRCRRGAPKASFAAVVAACARALGPNRDFYRTSDNVMDVEGVRKALGFERIGLFGSSYGTDVALAYARTFPSRVSRLLLDSVATPITALPLLSTVVKAIPPTLTRFCAGACKGLTADYRRDVVALARRLADDPLQGQVSRPGAGRRTVTLGPARFLATVLEGDLEPGLAAELPASVRAALDGEPQPLLRLADLVASSSDRRKLNAVRLATDCDDGPLPWPPGTPIAKRGALLKAAVAALPKGSFGPFDTWASTLGNADACITWPGRSVPDASKPASYPNVPVLAVSGALDLRSPTAEARVALRRFPRGHLLVVANSGHSALTSPGSPCLRAAVGRWLAGASVPSRCGGPRALPPVAFPSDTAPTGAGAETLATVASTLHEAEAILLFAYDEGKAVAGLATGKLTTGAGGATLIGYADTPGIALSGTVNARTDEYPVGFSGVVRVKDRAGTTIGELAVNRDSIDGTLQGAPVVAGRLAPSSPVPGWSMWEPPSGATGEVTAAIAEHVGNRYLIGAGAAPLVDVSSTPPTTPPGTPRHSLDAIAVRSSKALGSFQFVAPASAWTYTLCGRGARCAISSGEPSTVRFRLVSREALELALYTFEFAPGISSVVVYLPPAPGARGSTTVEYFERGLLAAELSHPLQKTLPRANPPVSTDPDPSEAKTIDDLTFSRLCGLSVSKWKTGPVLVLTRY